MKTKEIIARSREISKPFRISKGKNFRLKDMDPNDTLRFTKEEHKAKAKEALATGIQALAELQDKLYAQDRWAVLLIFQAMDAAGKDGAIKHVMSGVNPQGCQVYSFKQPSAPLARPEHGPDGTPRRGPRPPVATAALRRGSGQIRTGNGCGTGSRTVG